MSNVKSVLNKDADAVNFFGKQIEPIRPYAKETDEVDVKINPKAPTFLVFMESFVECIEDTMSVTGLGSYPNGITGEDVYKYLTAAVYARVCQVNKTRCVWERRDQYVIPSFLTVMLAQIGKVDKVELGLYLKPVWDGEEVQVDSNFLNRISRFLMLLEDRGFEMSRGLPRHDVGDWSVMSMQYSQGVVMNTTPEHHPAMALVASFFGVHGLAEVLSLDSYRVRYIDDVQASKHVRETINGNSQRV